MSNTEQHREERSAESLINQAMSMFGIDASEKERLRGIPQYALKSRVVGEVNKYKTAFEHGFKGDELTTIAYPADVAHARDRLTTILLSLHPLREDHAEFTDMRVGEETQHLEGIQALDRIAVFLAEAQADVLAVNS